MKDNKYQFYFKEEWAAIHDTNVDILECLKLFDKGFENIYVLNNKGEYHGLTILKKNFKKVWSSDSAQDWVLYLDNYLEDIDINNKNNSEIIVNTIVKAFQNRDLQEIPVVVNSAIVAVVARQKEAGPPHDWSLLKTCIVESLQEWSYNTEVTKSCRADYLTEATDWVNRGGGRYIYHLLKV